MKVLVTGAGGMLAASVAAELDRHGDEGFGIYLTPEEQERCAGRFAGADVCELGSRLDSHEALARLTGIVQAFTPDWVFHCAAWADVDGCESGRERAWRSNAIACLEIALAAKRFGARLLAVSTDYVFDGTASTPYTEDAPVGPRSEYGRSKLAGERLARLVADDALVVRSAWLFGSGGRNFVDTIRGRLAKDEPVRVVDDQRGCPTYTADLASGMRRLAVAGASGIVHATNSGYASWFEFAREIGRRMGKEALVSPMSSAELTRPAPRPTYSVLDGKRFAALAGGPLPDWKGALGRYMDGPATGQRSGRS